MDDSEIKKEIGLRIKKAREMRKCSQESLGKVVGRSKQAISAWETGRASVTGEQIIRISRFLGINVDAVLSVRAQDIAERFVAVCQDYDQSG